MSIAGLTVAGPVLDHAEDTGGAQTVVPGVRVYCDLLWIIGEAAVSGGNVIAGYGDVHVRAQGHGHTQRLHPERVVACCCRCLLYTSDAADEEDSVDLGGRRIIKKKK